MDKLQRVWWLIGLPLGLSVACFDPGTDACVVGAEGCECTTGNACDAGLECVDGTCEAMGETGDEIGDGDTTTGDGDGDTGDGDTTTGDGDMGDGDGDTGTGTMDMDMDGVPDVDDNCLSLPNPNQLDFDEDGAGNVCDPLEFNTVSGQLATTLDIDAGFIGSCPLDIVYVVSSGQVQVRLDDDASVAAFEITELVFEDVTDQFCNLQLLNPTFSFLDPVMSYRGGEPFPVTVSHSVADHDAGVVAGDSSAPHPMTMNYTTEMFIDMDPPIVDMTQFPAGLPIFTANITDAGSSGTLSWGAPGAPIGMSVYMLQDPVMVDFDFVYTGLAGALELAP